MKVPLPEQFGLRKEGLEAPELANQRKRASRAGCRLRGTSPSFRNPENKSEKKPPQRAEANRGHCKQRPLCRRQSSYANGDGLEVAGESGLAHYPRALGRVSEKGRAISLAKRTNRIEIREDFAVIFITKKNGQVFEVLVDADARLTLDGKSIYLGVFKTQEEAAAAVQKKLAEIQGFLP